MSGLEILGHWKVVIRTPTGAHCTPLFCLNIPYIGHMVTSLSLVSSVYSVRENMLINVRDYRSLSVRGAVTSNLLDIAFINII